MRFEPVFVKDLRDAIEALPAATRARVNRQGALGEAALLRLVGGGGVPDPEEVEAENGQGLIDRHDLDSDDLHVGEEAIRNGEVAYVVLAGGRGTRVGMPKAFLRLPKVGLTLATHHVQQASFVASDGTLLTAPIWFMTTPGDMQRLAFHMSILCPPPLGGVFEQYESYRLKPNYQLELGDDGLPDLHPTGHGDVGPALVEAAVFQDNPKLKHCVIVNVDNVMASIDPAIVGRHIRSNKHVTCEVFKAHDDETSTGLLLWNRNRIVVMDSFRVSQLDPTEVPYRSTNTMIVSVSALASHREWTWHRIRKLVGNRIVVQYERLLQQYTEDYDANYVLVDRDRRYCPVKTEGDLVKADDRLNGNKVRHVKISTL